MDAEGNAVKLQQASTREDARWQAVYFLALGYGLSDERARAAADVSGANLNVMEIWSFFVNDWVDLNDF